jgi:hypothetical protein
MTRLLLLRGMWFALILASAPLAWSAGLPNGTWDVQGRAELGTPCGHWFVRLRVNQGRLSGIVGVGQGNVPLQNVVLQLDGSFSGSTRETWLGPRHVRAFQVRGQFVGDTVQVTLENQYCDARSASARRAGNR